MLKLAFLYFVHIIKRGYSRKEVVLGKVEKRETKYEMDWLKRKAQAWVYKSCPGLLRATALHYAYNILRIADS